MTNVVPATFSATGSAVSDDFHTGILTVAAGLLIAITAKRFIGNNFRNSFERYADVLTLVVTLLPVSYALAGLATQDTSRDVASAMVFVTLVAVILTAATSLYRTLTTNSLLDDDEREVSTNPVMPTSTIATRPEPTHWLTVTINFGPRRARSKYDALPDPSYASPHSATRKKRADKKVTTRVERRKLVGSVVTLVFLIGLLIFATQDAFREVYDWSQSP